MTYDEKVEVIMEAFADRVMPEVHLKDGTVVVGIAFESPNVICEDPETGKSTVVKIDDIENVYC